MTAGAAAEFLNRVDDPGGEPWVLHIHPDKVAVRIEVGEKAGHALDFVIDAERAVALATYLRSAKESLDSVHVSVDKRDGGEIYIRIAPAKHHNWQVMFRDLAARHAQPEVADHLVVYRGEKVLLWAHDAGSGYGDLSSDLSDSVVEAFRDALGDAVTNTG